MANTSTSLAHKASTLDVNSSQIDYANLFGTDFARLTNDFDQECIYKLVSEASNEDRTFLIEAIRISNTIYSTKGDKTLFANYMQALTELSELQNKYYQSHAGFNLDGTFQKNNSNQSAPTIQLDNNSSGSCQENDTEDVDDIELAPDYNARYRGFLLGILAEMNGVFFDGDEKNINQTVAIDYLQKLFGGKKRTYKQKIIPNYNKKNDLRVLNKIAEDLKDLLPMVSERIKNNIGTTEK